MGKPPDPVENGELDNHGKPAMMVDSKGYIHVVFGAHGGSPLLGRNALGTPGSLRGGKLTHVVSKNPEDISAWVIKDGDLMLAADGIHAGLGARTQIAESARDARQEIEKAKRAIPYRVPRRLPLPHARRPVFACAIQIAWSWLVSERQK